MAQPTADHRDPALTRFEKLFEIGEQRLERCEHSLQVFKFVIGLHAPAETFGSVGTRGGYPAGAPSVDRVC